MRRSDLSNVDEARQQRVSPALVFAGVIAVLNVASAVATLIAA